MISTIKTGNVQGSCRNPGQNGRRRALDCSIVLIVGLASLGATGCCVADVSSTAVSPSGEYVARVERRNCGATTGVTTDVVLKKKTSFYKRDVEEVVWHVGGAMGIALVWPSNSELTIVHRAKKVDKQIDRFFDLSIRSLYMPPAYSIAP